MSDVEKPQAVEAADLPVPSESVPEPEIPTGQNIAEAVRNAVRVLGVGKVIGLAAVGILVPFGAPIAVATTAALIAKGRREG